MFGVAAVVTAVLIVILASTSTGGSSDTKGDARLIEGNQPRPAASLPVAAAIADIVGADVRSEEEMIVFHLSSAAAIPDEFEDSSLEFRFDLSEGGSDSWIVSATVNVAATAAVVSQASGYTSTTIDGSLPGSVEVSGTRVTITLDPAAIDGFPRSFDWRLSSTLTAFRDIAGSTRVEDRFPDEGTRGGP